MCFVRMDHNPMDSNPIGANSRWDLLLTNKNRQNCDKSVFESQNEVST